MEILSVLIIASLLAAAPLIATALGGMFSEKSGIVNIGLEGIMTFSAFVGATTLVFVENSFGLRGISALTIGLFGAIIGGVIFSLLHVMMSIRFKVDQIISGTIINILGLALAIFLTQILNYGSAQTQFKQSFTTNILSIPLIVYFILALIPLCIYLINKTKWGLRLRACGENPTAAKSTGIKVDMVRTQAVILSGVFAAIGGYSLVVLFSGSFSATTVAGKGFIALAILIFGQWKPVGILLSGLLFGFLSALGTNASRIFTGESVLPISIFIIILIGLMIIMVFIKNGIIRVLTAIGIYLVIFFIIFYGKSIPSVYFDILPYIITIVALTLYSKNSAAPAGLGK